MCIISCEPLMLSLAIQFFPDPWYICLFISMTQQKRKLRIYISNTYTPSKPEGEEAEKVSSWELRVEGKLLEEVSERHSLLHLNLLAQFLHRPSVVWHQVFLRNWETLDSGLPESLA